MMDRRSVLTLAFAATLAAAPAASALDLNQNIRQLVGAHDLRGTRVGILIMDMDSGEVLGSMNPDEQLIPASNMKLVTTAAALDVLGPDFVYRTQLGLLDATPGQPGAQPSLVVKGDGDPAFGDPQLLQQYKLNVDALLNGWVDAVKTSGHGDFGRLVIDDRVLDTQFSHPDWPAADLVKAYGAQVSGLNFYDNVIDVLPVPTEQGQAPRIQLFPPAPFLETLNRAKTGKTDYFTVDRKPNSNQLIFGGTVKNSRSVPFQVTVHDPAMVFGGIFATAVRKAGVEVGDVVRPSADEDLSSVKPLHVVQTTLPLVLGRTNQDSQNMFAESLFKRMGRQLTGQPGSWENGAAAIRQVLKNRLGARSASIEVVDGSGMSRNNRVTARLLTELLRSMYLDDVKGPIYRDSLSKGGVNGTLEERFEGLNGTVYGKSGYLNGVSSLSGYLFIPAGPKTAPEPRVIGFSFVFNGFKPPLYARDMKTIQNKLVDLIDEAVVSPAKLGG